MVYLNHLILSLKVTTSPITMIAGVGISFESSTIVSKVPTTTSCSGVLPFEITALG